MFKTHISLTVSELDRSIEFYRHLLGVSPIKRKSDYAKFDLDAPALNLSLVQKDVLPLSDLSFRKTPLHFGIQVEHSEDVTGAIARFKLAGIESREERDTNCCYALQDKVWVSDPDGYRWEIFVVKGEDVGPDPSTLEALPTDAERLHSAPTTRCCTPTCCH